jgi:methylmalonyl-CoA epimerase
MSLEQPVPESAGVPAARGPFRRLDHVAIAVWDADAVIPYYRDVLGLALVGDERLPGAGTRLVYFQAGEALVQLVEPVEEHAEVREWLAEYGEGLHHLCLVVDDLASAASVSADPERVTVGPGGRRRNACFLNGVVPAAVKIEVTETHPSR